MANTQVSMTQRVCQLPAGYVDASGVLHRQAELCAMTGREEEILTRSDQVGAVLVTEVLSRCVKRIGSIEPVTPSVVRQLLIGDRQYLLLMLRQLTFGDGIQGTLPCPWPGCGQGVDIDFRISEIPITPCNDVRPSYSLAIESDALESPLTIEYRLPNGADQEAVAPPAGTGAVDSLTVLLSRCLLRVGTLVQPGIDAVAALPGAVRLRIELEMEARAPNLDLTMEACCPACKRTFIAPFALQDFFFGELRISAELLYREVHYLAFHYHWSEEEILRMPRDRRRRYIDVLSDEIEKLNASVG